MPKSTQPTIEAALESIEEAVEVAETQLGIAATLSGIKLSDRHVNSALASGGRNPSDRLAHASMQLIDVVTTLKSIQADMPVGDENAAAFEALIQKIS